MIGESEEIGTNNEELSWDEKGIKRMGWKRKVERGDKNKGVVSKD